jgi:hypothetical protein
LASYLGSIYADAFSGRPQALLLLLGPLLCMGIWELRGWLCRRYLAPAEAE